MLIGIIESKEFSEKALIKLEKIGKVIKFENGSLEEFVKDKPILLYDVNDVIGMSEGKKPEWNE